MGEPVRELKLGVYGIVISDGNVLVIKKARGPYKGQFDVPGGGIEFGESISEGLAREFIEETGLRVTSSRLFDVADVHSAWTEDNGTQYETHHVGIYFLVEVSGQPSAEGDGQDSLGALFVPIAQLNESNTSKIALPVIMRAVEHHN